MADQVLTKQKLINADEDLGDLEEVLNGPPGKLIKTRLGREVYTLASVPQINTMTREEVSATVTPKADKVYVDNIVSAAANGVIPFQTQSELLLAKPTQVKVLAKAMDVRKEYLWNRTSAEGVTPVTGTWVDTGLSDLDQAKSYADTVTNINMFRGIQYYIPQRNAATFNQATANADFSPTDIRLRGVYINANIVVPYTGELKNKVSIWIKVKNSVAGNSNRFLVQAFKHNGSTFHSVNSPTIPAGTVGWFKLSEFVLPSENRAEFNNILLGPDVTGTADLTIEDVYIGETSPLIPFIRASEPTSKIVARNESKSLLPHWTRYPVVAGVAINSNGDITIPANTTYSITLPVVDANILHYAAYVDQPTTGDCRLLWKGFRKGLTTFQDIPYFPCAVKGADFAGSVAFDAVIDKVQLDITNYSVTSAITLKSFDICYSEVFPSNKRKLGERIDPLKVKADVVKSISSPIKNISSAPNFESVPKNTNGKRFASNGSYHAEYMNTGIIKPNTTYYVSLPDAIATRNGGSAKLVLYHTRADGTSLGGTEVNFTNNGGVLNASLTTSGTTDSFTAHIDLTGGATVELGRLILSESAYSDDQLVIDVFAEDKTGSALSEWEYPNLTGYSRWGNAVDYPITENEGELVINIPVTDAPGYGQGAAWNVNISQDESPLPVLSFLAKSRYTTTNPAKIWVRYYADGGSTELTARLHPVNINRDESWTLNSVILQKKIGATAVKFAQVFVLTDATSEVPLQLKRFILTKGFHNPYVKNILTKSKSNQSGLTDFARLTDALSYQPQNIFSVGRQMFRPLKTNQQTIKDYELIGGNQLLPKRLNNLRYIDSDGYQIAFLDRDDTVYLRKGTALYKTTVDDLNSRCVATTTTGGEKRGVFNSSGLTLINANVPNGFLRVTGNGAFVILSRSSASYSTNGGATWVAATGYQDVQGEHFNAWGTDCCDNIVLSSGYKVATEGRGTGRVNFSKDDGKTYQVILDLATSSFIEDATRSSMHIHAVKYDPYWDGVWVIMGDGAFKNPGSTVNSNIWFIEKPGTPEQTMISYNSRGQGWLNEQHVAVYPMQDCVLFGSDANPTGLYRMARTKNVNAFRDTVVSINTGLSHYGCGGYQHKKSLPMAIYFGLDGTFTQGGTNDLVYLTYDGVNIIEIYKEPLVSNATSGKVNTFAYALDEYFIFERRDDNRFSGMNTWIVADIQYMR